MKNPVIGVICKHLSSSLNPHHASGMVRDEVVRALIAEEAIPIGITFPKNCGTIEYLADIQKIQDGPTFVNIIQQVELCNGLVFQGGQSIDPMEYAIAEHAYRHNIPCLGFGSGQTVMAKVITPHLTIIKSTSAAHDTKEEYAHSITIDPHSHFHDIIGRDTIPVNSRHHRSVATCPSLHIGARDPEGNLEVLEDPTKTFYLATRFNPESLYETDLNMRKIFAAFVDACRS